MEFIKDNMFNFIKDYLLLLVIIVLNVIIIVLINYKDNIVYENNCSDNIVNIDEIKDTEEYVVDIKGAVKKPGVYTLDSNSIVNDVIKLAGGITNKGTTELINLSKSINNHMVIYVATKKEVTNKKAVSNQNDTVSIVNDAKIEDSVGIIENTDNNDVVSEVISNNLININTSSLEELIKIPNIGEAKAKSIINYRDTNGLFSKIDDIKNVSGIGESLFDKIKEYITV